MSRFILMGCMVVLVGSLAGCASTQTAGSPGKTLMQRETQVDEQYVGLVNTIAKQRGTRVIWVNPPKKTVFKSIASAN